MEGGSRENWAGPGEGWWVVGEGQEPGEWREMRERGRRY